MMDARVKPAHDTEIPVHDTEILTIEIKRIIP